MNHPSEPLRPARVKDVAAAAGVSVATVSRAFNPQAVVTDDTRKHVLAVAQRLGYSPHPAAKALRLQRSFLAGAIFPSTEYGFYARLLSNFQSEMNAHGYLSILLTVGFDNSKLFDSVRQLVDRGVEALMVVGRIDDDRLISYLLDRRIPVVTTYSVLPDAPFPSVGIDNYAATSQVMEHLLALGHKEFAMLSGPAAGNDRQQARRRAFLNALNKAGLRSEGRIFEDPQGYSLGYGTRAFHTLMQAHPEITALVCNSDGYGMAALLEARRMGISIPGKLSITGFDDQDFAELMDPPLTTVAVRADAMGKHAAIALLRQLEGSQPSPAHESLPAQLVVRDSTGPAPTRS